MRRMGDVARSAGKLGLKFGVYLSPWDRHDPRYSDPEAYDKYYLSKLEELVRAGSGLTFSPVRRKHIFENFSSITMPQPTSSDRQRFWQWCRYFASD